MFKNNWSENRSSKEEIKTKKNCEIKIESHESNEIEDEIRSSNDCITTDACFYIVIMRNAFNDYAQSYFKFSNV